jgi:DNA-directed RNA polymerase subunit K
LSMPKPEVRHSGTTKRDRKRASHHYKKIIRGSLIRALPLIGDCMKKYTRFEKARIIGARALQISLGAPVLIDIPEGTIDPIEIARTEFDRHVIPIDVKRD